jgi:Lon protease-like protein
MTTHSMTSFAPSTVRSRASSRALSSTLSSSSSAAASARRGAATVRTRAWWDTFGRKSSSNTATVESGEDGDGDAKASAMTVTTTTTTTTKIKAEDSLASLSALLGEDEAEAKARAEAEAADAKRAEAQAKERASKEQRSAREKAFKKGDAMTTRIQRLQAVFLDVPLGFLDSPFEKTFSGYDLSDDTKWFKLPQEVFDKVTGERFVVLDDDDAKEFKAVNGAVEEGKEIVRQPGEFQVPVIPYPFVAVPGSYVRLNLFEPRWLTLFSKLIPGTKNGAIDGFEDTDKAGFKLRGILEGVDGRKKINLNGSRVIDAYESGDRMFDIVPGYGRLPEDSFEQTNAFGAVYRGIDGRIAGVGTMMDICAHDVVVDGKLLAVVAKGQKRFKVLRVAQTEPYVIVDAVPIEDDAGADDAAAKKVDAVNAAGVMDVMTTLNKVDPYYMEAIGLTDFSKDDLKDMNEFDLANIMLYTHPTLALKLLAMTDATKRKDVVGAAAKGVLTSLNLGFTPRKSRLLFSFVNLGVLFGIGFVLLSLRQIIEGDASGFDNF